MAEIRNISVKVCGNPQATGGFMPITTFNSPNFQVLDVVYGGFHMNSYFFSVKIEPTQVVYKLIKNNVRSNGSVRQGSLVIAMSIPKGYKLAGTVTPYDVLMSLMEKFISSCMTCKDVATDTYEYNNGVINPTILDEVAQQYQLIPHNGPHRPMKMDGQNIGYITAKEEDIRLFTGDVQYSMFAAFSEVLIATSSSAANYTHIPNIAIPRISEYRIIDGMKDNAIVSNIKERITRKGNKNSNYYVNNEVSFTIEELKIGEVIANVELNEADETIIVHSDKLSVPRERKIRIVTSPSSINKGNIMISGNGQRINIAPDFSFTLRGEEIALLENPGSIKPVYNGNDYVITRAQFKGDDLNIELQKAAPGYSGGGNRGGNVSNNSLAINTLNAKEVLISLGDTMFVDKKKEIRLVNSRKEFTYRIFNKNASDKEMSKLRASDVLCKNRETNRHECSFYIPKAWFSEPLVLCITIDKCTFESDLKLGNNADRIEVKNWEPSTRKGGMNDGMLVRYMILFILGILLGFGIGFMVSKMSEKEILKCTYPNCGCTYENQSDLDRHMNTVHKFNCNYCKTSFDTNSQLENHLDENHRCPTCKNEYQTKGERDKCFEKHQKEAQRQQAQQQPRQQQPQTPPTQNKADDFD